MPSTDVDAAKMKAAIALAAGPAGEILSKFPAHYAKSLFFGERPIKGGTAAIANGTVTLVRLPQRNVAVTCWHVIDGFREYLQLYKRVIAQIGDTLIDPAHADNNDRFGNARDYRGVFVRRVHEVLQGGYRLLIQCL